LHRWLTRSRLPTAEGGGRRGVSRAPRRPERRATGLQRPRSRGQPVELRGRTATAVATTTATRVAQTQGPVAAVVGPIQIQGGDERWTSGSLLWRTRSHLALRTST